MKPDPKAIRERCEAATIDELVENLIANCRFIARARTDIPALLDYIEELEKRPTAADVEAAYREGHLMGMREIPLPTAWRESEAKTKLEGKE